MRSRHWMHLVLSILVSGVVVGPAAPVTAATVRVVSAWLPYWDSRAVDDFIAHRDLYDQVLPFWYEMRSTSSVTAYEGAGSAAVLDAARAGGVAVLPTVTNDFDPVRVNAMLATDANIDAHVAVLTELAKRYDGIDIDYESVYAGDRARFTIFTQRLGASVRAAGKQLSMTVHPKTAEPGTWDGPQSQDWAAIGAAADRVRIMAYDAHWSTSEAGGIAPLAWVDAVAAFAVTKIPAAKINLGMPLYGYDWVGMRGEGLTWDLIQERRLTYGAAVQRSADGSEPWFTYTASGTNHTVWYSDATSTRPKLDVIRRYGLGGMTFWRLGGEDPGVWDVVRTWATTSDPVPPTADTTPPTAVSSLTAVGGVRSVTLRWGRSSDSSAVRYEIWRATSSTGAFSKIATVSTTSYLNTGLRKRYRYYYRVRPVDAANNFGPMSGTVSALTS